MSLDLQVGYADWSKFARDVKRMDNEVAKELRRELTRIAKPIAEEVKGAARKIPTSKGVEAGKYRKKKGVEHGASLRQGIAAAVETKIQPTKLGNFSIRIRVSGTKFKAHTGKTVTLPRYMEGMSKRPFRHPVHGNREIWVSQQTHPYLLPTVIPHKPLVVIAVRKALEDAARSCGFK